MARSRALTIQEQDSNRLPKNYAKIKAHPRRPTKPPVRAPRDWRKNEETQKQRFSITLLVDKELATPEQWLDGESNDRPGRPRVYTDAACLACLQLAALFRMPLRGAEHMTSSILAFAGSKLRAPDHVTLFRARQRLDIPLVKPESRPPSVIILDGTGLKSSGAGEWHAGKHGADAPGFVKLAVALDYDSGQFTGFTLQPSKGDGTGELSQASKLLAQLSAAAQRSCAEVIGDKLYDCVELYEDVERMGAELVVPPCNNAIYGRHAQRDRHLKTIGWHGEKEWKYRVDYGRRSMVETAIGRLKALMGERLSARTLKGQRAEVAVRISALNRVTSAKAQTCSDH